MLKETIQVHYICLANMGKMHQNTKGDFYQGVIILCDFTIFSIIFLIIFNKNLLDKLPRKRLMQTK